MIFLILFALYGLYIMLTLPVMTVRVWYFNSGCEAKRYTVAYIGAEEREPIVIANVISDLNQHGIDAQSITAIDVTYGRKWRWFNKKED